MMHKSYVLPGGLMNKQFTIVEYSKSKITLTQLKTAYLKLFNSPESLKYLSFTSIPFTEELVESFITGASDSGISYLIALDSDTIIGIIILKEFIIEGFEILGLCVLPEYRKQGVGDQLITLAENKAGKNGYKSLKVLVFSDNKKMLSLLINRDYIPTAIQYHMRYDGMDVLELIKRLSQNL